MHRRRGKAQALGAARDGRIVDRLYINAVGIQQHVAQLLGVNRIADDDRHDMAAVVDQRQAQPFQAGLEDLRLGLMLLARFCPSDVLRKATDAVAPAASTGASEVEKMKPGA